MFSTQKGRVVKVIYLHKNTACKLWIYFCKIAPLNENSRTSKEGMMIISTPHCHCGISVNGSGHIKYPWIVVVFPTISGPEDIFISDFEHHLIIYYVQSQLMTRLLVQVKNFKQFMFWKLLDIYENKI